MGPLPNRRRIQFQSVLATVERQPPRQKPTQLIRPERIAPVSYRGSSSCLTFLNQPNLSSAPSVTYSKHLTRRRPVAHRFNEQSPVSLTLNAPEADLTQGMFHAT